MLGQTRGTGVRTKSNDKWKVSQYHLAIPIPNDIVGDVVDQVKQYQLH
nr:hypothetical protein [Alteromonas pelagimontana]